jgi:phosphate starvation-inducible PhoH-like protein
MPKGKNNTPKTRAVKTDLNQDTRPLKAMNSRQQQYINACNHDPVIICIGVLGSSKTYIPSVIAAQKLQQKQIERIIIARPAEGKGKSVGFFKGTKEEKLEGWCTPITETLKKRLGQGHYQAMLANGKIELLALEQVKGRSWDDAFIIVDEAEDLDPDVAKSLVTRQGVRSTMVIAGDIAQQDIKSYSGLQLLLDVAEHSNLDLQLINFDKWSHCVRSEEAKAWGMAFQKFERG